MWKLGKLHYSSYQHVCNKEDNEDHHSRPLSQLNGIIQIQVKYCSFIQQIFIEHPFSSRLKSSIQPIVSRGIPTYLCKHHYITLKKKFWPHPQHVGSQFPSQGSNLCPLHWKYSLNHWTTREVLHHIFEWALNTREKTMAPHSSTLAWKIPWTEEHGRLQSMGLLRVGHDWATSLSLFTFIHWRRKWQPAPVLLPGEPQGRGSPNS